MLSSFEGPKHNSYKCDSTNFARSNATKSPLQGRHNIFPTLIVHRHEEVALLPPCSKRNPLLVEECKEDWQEGTFLGNFRFPPRHEQELGAQVEDACVIISHAPFATRALHLPLLIGPIVDWGGASTHLDVALEGVTEKRGEDKALRRVEQWYLIVSGREVKGACQTCYRCTEGFVVYYCGQYTSGDWE